MGVSEPSERDRFTAMSSMLWFLKASHHAGWCWAVLGVVVVLVVFELALLGVKAESLIEVIRCTHNALAANATLPWN